MTRHINGFRPLREGERWYWQAWYLGEMPPGYRPLLVGERIHIALEVLGPHAGDKWTAFPEDGSVERVGIDTAPDTMYRTTEPLP